MWFCRTETTATNLDRFDLVDDIADGEKGDGLIRANGRTKLRKMAIQHKIERYDQTATMIVGPLQF